MLKREQEVVMGVENARAVAIAALAICVAGVSSGARAEVNLVRDLGGPLGFGRSCLGHNDDGSSAPIDITPAFPRGLHFFGETYTTLYVNTNGNVSFGRPIATYTPRAFPGTAGPMIAPYWADVDIRKVDGVCRGDRPAVCHEPSTNGVWWHLEPGRMVITWHQVGYYDCHVDKRMSFQLVLREIPGGCDVGGADFDVVFRYRLCEWTTGDASGGTGGLGGRTAVAGFDAGNGVDYVMIPGSRGDRIHRRVCDGSNVDQPGLWRFEVRRGAVVCPGAGGACETGMPGVCSAGVTSCVADTTQCVPEVGPSPERCDALDNDCDGMTDESDGTPLCSGLELCDRGACVETCFELGCADGFACNAEGRCVDAGCETMTCPAGQRCEAGACVGACDGVVCPAGRACRGGRCVDPCASLSCGDCGACDDGACVGHCRFAGCPAGESCAADGRCLETACASVTCAAGTTCRGGACVDACEGAVCPPGEACSMGECAPTAGPVPEPPAPAPVDGGTTRDAGTPAPGADGGAGGGELCKDGACGGMSGGSGCAIAPHAARTREPAWPAASLAVAVAWWIRARRKRRR